MAQQEEALHLQEQANKVLEDTLQEIKAAKLDLVKVKVELTGIQAARNHEQQSFSDILKDHKDQKEQIASEVQVADKNVEKKSKLLVAPKVLPSIPPS